MSDNISHLTADTFKSAVASSTTTPLLVDFWAPWCGPCKAIAPILEDLANELGAQVQICKVDVDHNTELAQKYNIRAIPTLLLLKDGQLKDQVVGLSRSDLKTDLKNRLQALA